MAQYLALLLLQQGYRIAASAESAQAQATQARSDLIIMDIVLEGGMDGIEAAQRINDVHAIPILYLTAHDNDTFFQRAKITRPDACLLKPPSARWRSTFPPGNAASTA